MLRVRREGVVVVDVFAGRFELIDPVGSGGNSMVWRAWDRRLERFCAAKVLRQRHAGALLRFVREQRVRVDHPQVLSPYSWAAEDDQALLAMDLVGGGSVSSLVADFGPLPQRYAAELLAQLLAALDHVHAAGLVHRDVKPANLLLEVTGTEAPVLRLSDFGIALSLGEPRLTQDGAVVGTPGYVAPEALAGEPPSIGQDLYAAGVTGWQLLTGEEPPTTGPVLSSPAGTGGHSILWRVVEDLVQPEAAERTPSAKAALAALAPLLAEPLDLPAFTPDGETIEVFDHLPPLPTPYAALAAPPTTEPEPPEAPESSGSPEGTRTPRRRRTGVLAASGVALVATAAVVMALTFNGQPDGDNRRPTTLSPAPETAGSATVTPAPNAAVKLGAVCGWQEAGNLETTADGTRIVCRQQGSSYRWIKAG